MAKKWIYDLTVHNAVGLMGDQETIDAFGRGADETESGQVISCDQKGRCFFDEVIRPNTRPLLDLLNRRGAEGWELVQYNYHSGYLYFMWKREA